MSTEADAQPLAEWEIELADSLLVDVDLSKEAPCDWGEIDGCTRPAAWVNTSSCCGLVTLHCPPHRVRHDELTIEHAGDYRCIRCRAEGPVYTWRPL